MVKVRTKPRFCREGTREEGDAIDALLALGDNINTKIRDRNREFFYNFLPPLCVVCCGCSTTGATEGRELWSRRGPPLIYLRFPTSNREGIYREHESGDAGTNQVESRR